MEPLIDIIRRMTDEKKEKNIMPSHIPYNDLQAEVIKQLKDDLNQMVIDNKIKAVRLINGLAVELK